jgi:hypothetical protein
MAERLDVLMQALVKESSMDDTSELKPCFFRIAFYFYEPF